MTTLDKMLEAWEDADTPIKKQVAAFERKFSSVIMGEPSAMAPDGKIYVTMTASGIKKQGQSYDRYFGSENEAAIAWGHEARLFGAGKSTLYWREKPSVRCFRKITRDEHLSGFMTGPGEDVIPDDAGPLFQVFSRLQVE